MKNSALYYPSIEFGNYEWLWSASLLWDRIYRIVPNSYVPEDCENVRILFEEGGEIGIPLSPDKYKKEVADEFLKKLDERKWDAAALSFDIPKEYAKIHQDKVDVVLREMIISKGKAASHDDWLYVPTEFEALYMTYLAETMSKKNELQLLSDSAAAWTGATYFKHDGEIEDYPRDEFIQQLGALVIRDFLPNNIMQITPQDLAKFRSRYSDERRRFLNAIKKISIDISESDHVSVLKDRIEDTKKEIEASLQDFRGSLSALKYTSLTGIKSLTFPVATSVATHFSGVDLNPTNLAIISSLGVGFGLISGLKDYKSKKRKLIKESDYSYLLSMRREWTNCTLGNHDYNYFLCRQVEEFIND